MLKLKTASRFKKDFKKYQHNPRVIDALSTVINLLLKQDVLPEKYCDHALIGQYAGMRECHIKPDTLLIYTIYNEYLGLERIGSHSELF